MPGSRLRGEIVVHGAVDIVPVRVVDDDERGGGDDEDDPIEDGLGQVIGGVSSSGLADMSISATFSQDIGEDNYLDLTGRVTLPGFYDGVKDTPPEILEDAGLKRQARAPMTPIVKLIFGSGYDKTRLTEYASALSHAQRIGLGRGALAGYLAAAPGGLKGVVSTAGAGTLALLLSGCASGR